MQSGGALLCHYACRAPFGRMEDQVNQRSISNPLVILAPFLGAFLSLAPTPGRAQATVERTVWFSPGVPLRTLLKPTDTVLNVMYIRLDKAHSPAIPDGPPPTLVGAVDDLIAEHGLVVGTITGRTSRLTESEDWIESTFRLQIERTLKPGASIKARDVLSIEQSGGELSIDNRLVRAIPSFERPYEVGGKYLAPLRRSATGLQPRPSVFQFKDGKLFDLQSRREGDDGTPLDGASAAEVMALIEARMKQIKR